MRFNSERFLALVHPAASPAGAIPRKATGSGRVTGHRRPNQHKPTTLAFGPEGERGYDAFSSKSLNSQTSEGMVLGSPISTIIRHQTSNGGLTSSSSPPPPPPKGQGRGEDSSAGGQAGAAPEVFLPSAGAGYDSFSSKSLLSNGSCSSMSELSIPPFTARGLSDGRAGQRGLGGGPGGDPDDGDSVGSHVAPDGYSTFKHSSQTGIDARAHHRMKSISSSTKGAYGGGGGGSSSAVATGEHRQQVSAAGTFGGAVDVSSVVEVPENKGQRRTSMDKIWPTAGGKRKEQASAIVDNADSEDDDAADVSGGSGYDGFNLQPAGELSSEGSKRRDLAA